MRYLPAVNDYTMFEKKEKQRSYQIASDGYNVKVTGQVEKDLKFPTC